MIKDDSAPAIELVRNRARVAGVEDRLRDKLEYLSWYGCPPEDHERTRVELFPDFDQMSLSFAMYKRQDDGSYRYWFNGGLIYHSATMEYNVHT